MEGIRICFPFTGLENKNFEGKDGEHQSDATKDLFTVNLDMGPVGKARLVVSQVNELSNSVEEANICVKLSVTKEYLGEPLSLRVSKFLLNEDGSLNCKVIVYF